MIDDPAVSEAAHNLTAHLDDRGGVTWQIAWDHYCDVEAQKHINDSHPVPHAA